MSKEPNLAPGCCGPIEDRIATISKVATGLVQGHRGMAALYESVARDLEDPGEKEQVLEAAAKHRRLATESETITLPEGFNLPGSG